MASWTLHVNRGPTAHRDALKVLVAAAATDVLKKVSMVALAGSGAVHLEVPGRPGLFSANEAARFFALEHVGAHGTDAYGARCADTDEWLAWEERVVQPMLENGTPLSLAELEAIVQHVDTTLDLVRCIFECIFT